MEDSSQTRNTRILVVDDDKLLLDLMSRALRQRFDHVTAISDPVAAEALLREQPESIDILLTDIAMPKLTGPQLAQIARRIKPRLTILFVSGFVKEEDQRAMPGNSRLLCKPFTPTELIAFIDGKDRIRQQDS